MEQVIELDFITAFGPECPESLHSLKAGVVKAGQFFPYGSVAAHFANIHLGKQRELGKAHVYFIRSIHGSPVKIGKAHDIKQRLATLQTAHPYKLEVIGIIPNGGDEAEKRLHSSLTPYRLMGEWFEWNPQLEQIINEVKNEA